MANLYDQVSITGYNDNPPDDDGSQTEDNRVKWSTIKTKITDPVKDRTDDLDANIAAAFDKVDGGITSYSSNTQVQESDQGKLVRATVAGITIETPDAVAVGSPFVFDFRNASTGDVTFDGYDTQTVDGLASFTVPAGSGFRVRTDGSNWETSGRNFQRTQVKPQGYLTLLSVSSAPTSPIPTSDQSAKTTVYYRPDGGNLLPISDGTNITVREFSELSLALVSNHVANGIYDVFAFDDSGTIRIGTGPVWNTVTAGSGARGTGSGTTELDLLKGLLVNKVSATMRNGSSTYSVAAKAGIYLGTILIDGSAGQVTCHASYGQSRRWGVWNAFNQRPLRLKAGDSTSTWSYSSTTVRPSNNATSNNLTVVMGVQDLADITFNQRWTVSVANGVVTTPTVGIGVNSTTAFSGTTSWGSVSNGGAANMAVSGNFSAEYSDVPPLGANVFTSLESSLGGGNSLLGTETNMLLKARWRG